MRPDVFWYDAPTKVDLPFNIVGLLAFEFWAMQFVELKRWQVRQGHAGRGGMGSPCVATHGMRAALNTAPICLPHSLANVSCACQHRDR